MTEVKNDIKADVLQILDSLAKEYSPEGWKEKLDRWVKATELFKHEWVRITKENEELRAQLADYSSGIIGARYAALLTATWITDRNFDGRALNQSPESDRYRAHFNDGKYQTTIYARDLNELAKKALEWLERTRQWAEEERAKQQ